MYPFFDRVITPLIRATRAQRLVEIGALRGETTVLLLELLGDDAELHVIDPVPQFDPTEHEARFPGRYIFHRDTSHSVLPTLPPMDAALVDGDHNWFTVKGELDLLAERSEAAGQPLPVLIMHDVLWPYGRRDLYYAPERIPEEYRQPHRQAGMLPGVSRLLDAGGVNRLLDNAEEEGGPRNGVMTALDDFVAEYAQPLRVNILPIYFGLAIVADERRISETPGLAEELDRLESPEMIRELLELGESLRIQGMVNEQYAIFGGQEAANRAAHRYLELLKGSLLGLHGLENEARIEYLTTCLENGREPDAKTVRDPGFHLLAKFRRLAETRRAGTRPMDAPKGVFFPYTSMGRAQIDRLEGCLDTIRTELVAGDLAACGVGRGGGAVFMRGYLDAYEMEGRDVWVADRFLNPEEATENVDDTADLNMVRNAFDRFGLFDDRVRFLQGTYAETSTELVRARLALLRIGPGAVAGDLLSALYGSVAIGGFVMIEGGEDVLEGAEAARSALGITEPLEQVGMGGAVWRKLSEAEVPATDVPVPSPEPSYSPLAARLDGEACDLSVIVVVHNMKRVAHRTLTSLTATYQREIEDLDYEVIVVENGSRPDQALGAAHVESYGPQFKYLDLADRSTPSPAQALNRGLELTRGRVVAFMIDGAHVLTPGVFKYALQGLNAHAPAVAATQQWYVGPAQQIDTTAEGYDEEYEDRLFKRVDWPADGYRLFDIGHFVGLRDWFDGMWESNCIFVPRQLLEQAGGMDEGFSIPGGGFANLDLFERVTLSPGVSLVTMLGEASFHQVHGGTTTNEADAEKRAGMIASYHRQYSALRGRKFRVPAPYHYVGTLREPARRTRGRRYGAGAFVNTGREIAADRRPDKPMPLPEETQAEFTEAYWRSFRWQRTRWMGRPIPRAPADLLAYQELIADSRPDWIVDIHWDDSSAAEFLASICDLVGHGSVVTASPNATSIPAGPRLARVDGDPHDWPTIAKVLEHVGSGTAMLVLGLHRASPLIETFDRLKPLVPVGGAVVFEDTIMNGNPIWPGMGYGPSEAVGEVLNRNPDFAHDERMLRLTPSFNSNGYLIRKPADTGEIVA